MGWYNLEDYSHSLAIKLLGENEQEFGADSKESYVIYDGCKVSRPMLKFDNNLRTIESELWAENL